MNTADRSIALVDAALRRRFRVLGFAPDYEALSSTHDFDDLDAVEEAAEASQEPFRRLLALSILAIRQLNARIIETPDLGKGKQIGHSFLWDVETTSDLCTVWQFEILPLIEEYYFGQFDRIRDELFRGGGTELFDFEREQIRELTPSVLGRELASLVEIDPDSLPTLQEETGDVDEHRIRYSINVAVDSGLVSAGDHLVFDEEKVPGTAAREYDPDDPFWRCEVTGNLGQQNTVRWLGGDEELYSLSGLAKRILSELGKDIDGVNGPIYWRVPSHEDELLRNLVVESG